MVRPLAWNVTFSPWVDVAARRKVTRRMRASAICDATVRFQMRSYRRRSSAPRSSCATSSTVRMASPAGRIASWASCAFFTLERYSRGWSGRYASPYSARMRLRAALTACAESDVESVRM